MVPHELEVGSWEGSPVLPIARAKPAERDERPERAGRVVQLEPARKRMQAAARKAGRTDRWQSRRSWVRVAAAKAALVTLVGSAAIGAVGGLTTEFVGLAVNRDHAVREAEQFSAGRPAQATDAQASVGRHHDDNGWSWAIDRVRVSLPGDPAWIETENIQGYDHRIDSEDPPYRDWQDPEPLHHYAAPTAVHVLSGPHGPRVMTDEDIHYWLTTPWPHFWHQARFYGWFGIGWGAAVAAGFVIQEEGQRRRSREH